MRPGQGKNVQETKKRNIEIINNLKQTLSTPTIVQAQRTLKIMDKAIERIGIFLNLDSEFVIKFNEINNPAKLKLNKALIGELSGEVVQLLVKEARLESEFKSYALVEQQVKDGEALEAEKVLEYNRVKKDMEYNFKSLVRRLEKGAGEVETLRKLKSGGSGSSEGGNIHEALVNYKIIMQKKLATAAEEEDSHTKQIDELKHKIESLEKSKHKVSEELRLLRQEKAAHMEHKKHEIDKLKSQIREVHNYEENELQKILTDNHRINDELHKLHKNTEDKLKAEIAAEKLKLTKLREDSFKNELKLKADKISNEANLIELTAAYDKEMLLLVNTKTQTQRELKRISDELNNLKRHFKEIEEERQREEALILADKRRKEKWELIERKKGQAITKIKEAYRLWKAKSKKKKKKPVKK